MSDITKSEFEALLEDARVPSRKVTVDTNTNRPRTGYVVDPNDIVETARKRARGGWDNILHHVSAENLARLVSELISKPDLTPAERTLGDYVMSEVSAG